MHLLYSYPNAKQSCGPHRLGTLHSTWERVLGAGGILLKKIRKTNQKKSLCCVIYYKYSTNTSIPSLAMPSSGKILHAFSSVRACQHGVSTCGLFLQEDMWIYACFFLALCAVPPGLQVYGPKFSLKPISMVKYWWKVLFRFQCSFWLQCN